MKFISYLITVVLVVVVLGYYSEGMKQELWLYTKEGYQLYFDKNYTDLTGISKAFPVVRVCAIGIWNLCKSPNFANTKCTMTSTYQNSQKHCESVTTLEVQSLRPSGPADTSVESISFYSEPDFNGVATIIINPVGRALIDIIPEGSKSAVVTGTASWTFFDGMFLNGSSVFLKPQTGTSAAYIRDVNVHNMKTIGSILKECS